MPKLICVKSPFYRLGGSHNNQLPIELSYWAGAWTQYASAPPATIYNGDYTPAVGYWSWRQLMQNTDLYKNMVDGQGEAMLLEVLEAVLSLKPTHVILSNDDTFMPSKCNDSPFVAARLAGLFKRAGIHTTGVGTFAVLDRQFDSCYDLILKGGPNKAGVDLITAGAKGFYDVGSWDIDSTPTITRSHQPCDLSYVVGVKGCSFPCSFCYNTKVSNRFIERDIVKVVRDLQWRRQNSSMQHYYFSDQIFTRNPKRMSELAQALKSNPWTSDMTFTVEGRSELIRKHPEVARTMAYMGVQTVKIGVENVGKQFNKTMMKRQHSDGVMESVEILRKEGLKVGAYLMLGGDTTHKEYLQTIDFCKEIDFDSYVISVLSQPMNELGTDKYKYDTHWSLARQKEYGISDEIVDEYLKLQESKRGNPDLVML